MLIRRSIDTLHNFANKPVFFACNGVQTRRCVSHKAGTEEGGRTARNSRNASRARKKNLQKTAQRAAACLMIHGKQRQGVQHPERTTAARHGERDIGKGQGCAPWGEYKGGRKREAGAGEKERKAQRGEKDRRGVVVWVQLLARAYIYSCYI